MTAILRTKKEKTMEALQTEFMTQKKKKPAPSINFFYA